MKNPDFNENNLETLKETFAIFKYVGRMKWVKLSDSLNLNFRCALKMCLE